MSRFKSIYLAILVVFVASACTSPEPALTTVAEPMIPAEADSMPNQELEAERIAERFPKAQTVAGSEVRYIITRLADGPIALADSNVSVNYRGMLWNGDVFDSSYDRGRPIQVLLGRGNVIRGWDQGIPGMRVGEKRTLIIPYSLAYGTLGSPPSIPARATLIFNVELMAVN